ncbi:hypothetical protein RhiJN_17330 [Ceratobasidium sp. AG-Ba]|nr:hypothetical protein RhiJN_17330 [Ceratobasidium sp. AG-Ba]
MSSDLAQFVTISQTLYLVRSMAQFSGSRSRLLDIFPPGFDSRGPSQSSYRSVPYTFTPEQLYYRLTHDYGSKAESVLVKSVWYGKKMTVMRHEFILVEVEDTNAGVVNFIVLDRNKEAAGAVIGNAVSDAFRVSHNGIEMELLEQCLLLPRQYAEKLEFDRVAEPMYLYELVTLVNVLSQTGDTFNLGSRDSYWFSGLLWVCLRQIRPDGVHTNYRPKLRGRFGLLRHTPDKGEKEKCCNAFYEDIVKVEERLKHSRQMGSAIRTPGAHSERFTPKTRFSMCLNSEDPRTKSSRHRIWDVDSYLRLNSNKFAANKPQSDDR